MMDGVCGCGLALVVLQVASFGTKFLWIFRAKFLFGAEGTTVLQPPATIDTVGTESCAIINTVCTKVRDKFCSMRVSYYSLCMVLVLRPPLQYTAIMNCLANYMYAESVHVLTKDL